MTDRELLLENNAKLKTIQETLKNKMLSIGETGLTVSLPDELATSTNIYYFKLDDNTLLFSSNVSNIGLWKYSIDSQTWTQIYNVGNGFDSFDVIDSMCFISGDGGLLLYDLINDNITKIYSSTASWHNVYKVGNKIIMTNTSSGYSDQGALVYDILTGTIEKIYSKGNMYQYIQVMDDKCLISNSYGNTGALLLYNATTNTTTVLKETPNWTYFRKIGNKCLLSNRSSGILGLHIYDYDTDTVTPIYEEGYQWEFIKDLDENTLLISSRYSNGALVYDILTGAIKKLTDLDIGRQWEYVIKINNDYIISSSYSSSYGVWLYDRLNDTTQQLLSTGVAVNISQKVGEILLLSSSSSSLHGLYCYDITLKTLKQLYTSGSNWTYFQLAGNKVLIGSASNSVGGFLRYDIATNTAKLIYSYGYFYSKFTLDGDNCYVEGTNKTQNPYKLYYNSVNDSCKLVEYYLGDV